MPVPTVTTTTSSAPTAAPSSVLGDRRQVRVVVDEHGDPEPFGHDRSERKIGELKVDGDDRFPGPRVDQRGNPEADGGDLRARVLAKFVNRVLYGCEERDLVETDHVPLHAMVNAKVTVEHSGQ